MALLAVDFTPMCDAKNENGDGLVLDVADHAIVADPITPEVAQRTSECLA